ncbi:MAG TPA: hypothetical protein VFW37_00855 [Alphaproteobacteria bacterium]|nr:hypothetical protein [Alphaproteobacteria bacterium]
MAEAGMVDKEPASINAVLASILALDKLRILFLRKVMVTPPGNMGLYGEMVRVMNRILNTALAVETPGCDSRHIARKTAYCSASGLTG